MAGQWETTVLIERPIEEVFGFLADGQNDKKFSPRVEEIVKKTDGPVGVGTIYVSRVKDAGLKSDREFELTEFQPPTRIRWKERSKNAVMVPEGGYDLAPDGSGTQLTVHNVLEGHGLGKLLEPLALRSTRKGADDFGERIKAAVEA
jgi:carbon monoxide dehydrogenase subunit G